MTGRYDLLLFHNNREGVTQKRQLEVERKRRNLIRFRQCCFNVVFDEFFLSEGHKPKKGIDYKAVCVRVFAYTYRKLVLWRRMITGNHRISRHDIGARQKTRRGPMYIRGIHIRHAQIPRCPTAILQLGCHSRAELTQNKAGQTPYHLSREVFWQQG